MFPVTFVSEVGHYVRSMHANTYSTEPTKKVCYYYDGLLSIAYTLEWMLNKGRLYEVPQNLGSDFKKTVFTGCSGLVSFLQKTNDRNTPKFQIEQL
jgi:hypothetical protein